MFFTWISARFWFRKVAVSIAVDFINEDECPGIKVGGVLNVVRYEVELLCQQAQSRKNHC